MSDDLGGVVMADLLVVGALRRAFASLREDQGPLNEVFAALEPADRERITRWFSHNDVPVKLAFPREPSDLPGVYVLVMPSEETWEGGIPDEKVGSRWQERYGAIFDVNLSIGCWTDNPEVASWLSWTTAAMMLRYRLELTESGLDAQKLSLLDLAVARDLFPTPAFRRDVRLRARTPAVITTNTWPPLAGIEVVAEGDAPRLHVEVQV